MSSLPWWFTKGRCSTPATEPRILPSPRPPPAWGSCLPQFCIQHSVLLVLLSMAPPTSALSPQEPADISSAVPCPVSLVLMSLLLLPWTLLHLQPYLRTRWCSTYMIFRESMRCIGSTHVGAYLGLTPFLLLGAGWWFVMWYFILCDHGWDIIELISRISIAILIFYGCYRMVVTPFLHLTPALSTAVTTTVNTAYVHFTSPIPTSDMRSASQPRPVPTGSPTSSLIRQCLLFLFWLGKQTLLGSLIPLWATFVAHFNLRSYSLAFITIPAFFLLTDAPPCGASPWVNTSKSPLSLFDDAIAWGLCPTFLSGAILYWMEFIQAPPLPP